MNSVPETKSTVTSVLADFRGGLPDLSADASGLARERGHQIRLLLTELQTLTQNHDAIDDASVERRLARASEIGSKLLAAFALTSKIDDEARGIDMHAADVKVEVES